MAYFESASHQSLSERELVFICNLLRIDHRVMNKATMTASIDYLFSTPSQNGPIPIGRVAIPYRALVAKLFYGKPSNENEMYVTKEDLWRLAKFECIDEKCFDWISIRNDRMCSYIWSSIRIATRINYSALVVDYFDIFDDRPSHFDHSLYNKIAYLDMKPKNNDIKIKEFKSFIDILDLLPEHKIQMVKSMNFTWDLCTKNNDMVAWFGDMHSVDGMKKCHWAWGCICKKNRTSSTTWFINNDNKNDLYNGLITAFDLSLCNTHARKNLIMEMKRAWAQKKLS